MSKNNVRIAIRDSTDSHNVAFFDNKAGIKYKSANLHRFLAGSASILTIKYNSKDIDSIRSGCKLAFRYKARDYWLNVMSFEKKGFEAELTAYSLGLELNNETRGEHKPANAMSIAEYVGYYDPEHALTIGVNEVSDKRIKLEWTGTDTILARLFSVANSFGAELDFSVELNDDYSLKRQVLNIYKKGNLGTNKVSQPVRVGKELKVINYSDNIKELRTAVRATGKDGLTIDGLDKKIYDNNKELLYYSSGMTVYAPQSRDRFPSVGKGSNDNWIVEDLGETQYETKEALWGYMYGEIQKKSLPEITYEVEGAIEAGIGDTQTLIDDIHFEPTLYVQARVSELEDDILTGKVTKSTFINFERKYSQIADILLKQVEALAEDAAPYIIRLSTNNGYIFKNGEGSSTITARLEKYSKDIAATWKWVVDNKVVGTGDKLTVKAEQVTNTMAVTVIAYVNGNEVVRDYMTFSNSDDGVGVESIDRYFTSSDQSDGVTIEGAEWSDKPPAPTEDGKYLWAYDEITYTDGTVTTTKPAAVGANFDVDAFRAEIAEDLKDVPNREEFENKIAEELANSKAEIETQIETAKTQAESNAKEYADTINQETAKVAELANAAAGEIKADLVNVKNNLTETSLVANNAQAAVDAAKQELTNVTSDLNTAKQELTSHAQQLQTQANAQTELTKRVTTVETTANGTKMTVNELSKTVDSNTKNITSVTARTKVVEDDLTSTKTTLSQVQTTADDASSKAATLETGLNGVKADLAATTVTADTTKTNLANYQASNDRAVANLQSNLQEANGNISSLKTKVEAVPGQITSAVSAVEGKILTSVGGRNLWIQSKTTGNFVEETLPDNHITGQKKCYRISNNNELSFNIEPDFSPRLYQKVTFSAWVKYENVVQGTNNWNVFNCFKHLLYLKNSSTGVTSNALYLTLEGFTGTSDWKYITYTYDYAANKSYDQLKTSLKFNLEGARSGTAWVTGVKVEIGSTPSDYTPAPEDTAEQISSLSSEIKQTADGMTLLATKTELNTAKTELQNGINTATNKANNAQSTANSNAQTISTHTTQISALNTGLSAKVSQTDFNTLSGRVTNAENNITAKANELSSKITSVEGKIPTSAGGRNLALDTSADWNNGWTSFNGQGNQTNIIYRIYNRGLKVGDKVNVRIVLKYSNIVAAEGQTASGIAQCAGNVTNWGRGQLDVGSSFIFDGSSGEIELKGTTVVDESTLENEYWNWQLRVDYVKSGKIQWKEAKAEAGDLPTPWSPAPEDVESKIPTDIRTVNLVKGTGSAFIMGYGITNTTWNETKKQSILDFSVPGVRLDISSEILPQENKFFDFKPIKGTTYTQSMMIDTDATFEPNGQAMCSWFTYSGHNQQKAYIKKVGDHSYQVWSTYTWNLDDVALRAFDWYDLYKVLLFRTTGTYLAFYKPKMTIGNLPSDWSPAPEDYYAALTQATSEFKQTTDAIKASVSSLDNSTVKSSSLTINADGIVMKAGKSTTDVANAIGSYFAVNQNAINLFSDKINVKGNMIVSGAITSDKIASKSINTAHLNGKIITADVISSNAVTANAIKAGAVTTDKMSANSINGDRITAGTLDAAKIKAGSITASQIASGTITSAQIKTGTISSANIATGAITANKIAAGAIDASKIAANAITANMITGGQLRSTNGATVFDLNAGTLTFNNESGYIQRVAGDKIFAIQTWLGADSNSRDWLASSFTIRKSDNSRRSGIQFQLYHDEWGDKPTAFANIWADSFHLGSSKGGFLFIVDSTNTVKPAWGDIPIAHINGGLLVKDIAIGGHFKSLLEIVEELCKKANIPWV